MFFLSFSLYLFHGFPAGAKGKVVVVAKSAVWRDWRSGKDAAAAEGGWSWWWWWVSWGGLWWGAFELLGESRSEEPEQPKRASCGESNRLKTELD